MSNAVPTDDQTFLGKFRKDLENGGMFPDMAQAVIDSVVEGEKSSAMAGRWMDDPAGYPAMMYNVLWILVKTYALTYIDKHAPQAWFRPVFLPVSEQTKFLEDCRKEHRDAAASCADPAGLLYKSVGPVSGRISSKEHADTVVSITKAPVECPSLDTLVSVANVGSKLTVDAVKGVKMKLYPHQQLVMDKLKVLPEHMLMAWPVKAFALRDGGAYLNRLGERIEVKALPSEPDEKCWFVRTNGCPDLFMADGRFNDSVGNPVNDFDLIEEIVPLKDPNSISRFNDMATDKPRSMRPLILNPNPKIPSSPFTNGDTLILVAEKNFFEAELPDVKVEIDAFTDQELVDLAESIGDEIPTSEDEDDELPEGEDGDDTAFQLLG